MAIRKDDEQEMSMEEILASIRKYVTEDGAAPETASNLQSNYDDEEILDLKHVGASIIDHPPHAQPQFRQSAPAQPVEAPQAEEPSHTVHSFTAPQAPAEASDSSSLTSGRAMTASAQALSRLVETAKSVKQAEQPPMQQQSHPAAMTFNQGLHTTLETLAIQAMTPMVKTWIDTHLPPIVESLVQREIQRITEELLQK